MIRDNLIKSLSKFLKNNKIFSTILGDFIIGNQLGEGGTSIVREATLGDKKYAIKFLLENIKEKESTAFKRFKQAYINISMAQHTSAILPQIHFDKLQLDEHYIIPYTIMPKIDMTLKEWHKRDDFSFEKFEKVFKDLMIILDKIHDCNIIHRDIKPENLFIFEKKLVLGDFDIAKFEDTSHVKLVETKKNERLANFAYSAPEQSQRDIEFKDITKNADWYAVGQILLWLITGQTLRGHMSIDLQQYDKRYIKYESIISKLLKQNPEERFGSKEEIDKYLINQEEQNSGLNWDDGLFEFEEYIIDKYTFGKEGFYSFTDENDINDIMIDLSKYNNFVLEKGNVYFTDVRLWWTQGRSNNAINESIEKIVSDCQVWKIGYIEMNIKSIWLLKHYSGFGGSFLIIETDDMDPTGLYEHYKDSWDEEYAIYKTTNITRNEYDSGWAMIDGKRIRVSGKTELRRRVFKPVLFFIAPCQTSIHDKVSDDILLKILKKYRINYKVTKELLKPLESLRRREKVLMND